MDPSDTDASTDQSTQSSLASGALASPPITMHCFLDFLKLSCRVQDQLVAPSGASAAASGPATTTTTTTTTTPLDGPTNIALAGGDESPIDLNELARNPLVNSLLSSNKSAASHPLVSPTANAVTSTTAAPVKPTAKTPTSKSRSLTRRKSSGRDVAPLHPALEQKLSEVVDEGILDSVLQYMCPPPSTAAAAATMAPMSAATSLASSYANHSHRSASQSAVATLEEQQLLRQQRATTAQLTAVLAAAAHGDHYRSPAPPTVATTTSTTPGAGDSVVMVRHQTTRAEQQGNGKQSSRRKSSPRAMAAGSGPLGGSANQSSSAVTSAAVRHTNNVTIHVCDELKHITREFVCPQDRLCAAMGYFADVTAGQRLEDMDISVHCDVQIFEWLMRWVRSSDQPQSSSSCAGTDAAPAPPPQLDAANVVPILVSAAFLQMEPLLCDCLAFCHARLGDVVRTAANTACLSDAIVTRLAAMFTNLELEAVRDRRERLTPRLWCKLIQSLAEPEPQQLRGHYACVVDLFRCVRCGQYMTPAVAAFVHCTAPHMRLSRWGQLVARHQRDASWSLSNYVQQLHRALRSWRRVYWRLWGACHYLWCVVCERYVPVARWRWCQYHPEQAQWLGPAAEGRMAGPAGRWPCCQQQAFRYEALPGGGSGWLQQGCAYREHTAVPECERDRAILRVLQRCEESEDGGCVYEPAPELPQPLLDSCVQQQQQRHQQQPGNAASGGAGEFWWQGLQLQPHRSGSQGLLPPLHEYAMLTATAAATTTAADADRGCGTRSGGRRQARQASNETTPDDSDDDDDDDGDDDEEDEDESDESMRRFTARSRRRANRSGGGVARQFSTTTDDGSDDGCESESGGGGGAQRRPVTATVKATAIKTGTTAAGATRSARTASTHQTAHHHPTSSSSSSMQPPMADTTSTRHQHRQKRARAPKLSAGRHWSSDMSARSNQDHQREFEERAMRQVIAMVGRRCGGNGGGGGGSRGDDTPTTVPAPLQQPTTSSVRGASNQYHQLGGLYVRLEAEWRESVRQKLGNGANTHRQHARK